MVRFTLALALPLLVGVLAIPNPRPVTPDPSGDKNIGNGQGTQFITGACLSDADCQSGCCATIDSGGICSAEAAANEQGKQGCGFGGDGQAAGNSTESAVSAPAASTPAAATTAATQAPAGTGAVDEDAAGSQNVGTGNGQQFITGQCLSDADCASGCCAGREGSSTGACSAEAVAEADGKTGCGFVQA
ncbi:hypothetical protein ACJ41O_006229 [Fusarium nematophilum]